MDLLTIMAAEVDGRLAGLDPATALRLYSTENHATATYVRNPGCWLAARGEYPAVDYSALCVWNSYDGHRRACFAISRRHVQMADHLSLPVETDLRFLGTDGQMVTATITGLATYTVPGGSDICIALLSEDLPETVSCLPIVSGGYLAYLPNGMMAAAHVPCVGILGGAVDHPYRIATVSEWIETSRIQAPANATRLSFHDHGKLWDSGNAILLLINGQLVLVSHWMWAYGGPDYPHYLGAINTGMATLQPGGEQLTIFDFSGFEPSAWVPPPTLPGESVADAYFYNTGADPAWKTVANWFTDSGHTTPKGSLPGGADACIVAAGSVTPVIDLEDGTWVAPASINATVSGITVTAPTTSTSFDVPLTLNDSPVTRLTMNGHAKRVGGQETGGVTINSNARLLGITDPLADVPYKDVIRNGSAKFQNYPVFTGNLTLNGDTGSPSLDGFMVLDGDIIDNRYLPADASVLEDVANGATVLQGGSGRVGALPKARVMQASGGNLLPADVASTGTGAAAGGTLSVALLQRRNPRQILRPR